MTLGATDEDGWAHSDRSGQMRGIAVNTIVLTLGLVLGRAAGLVYLPLVARQLGSSALGAYQLSNQFIASFTILVLFGLSPLVVRQMAQRPTEIPRLFAESLALRLLIAVFAVIMLAMLLAASDYPPEVAIMSMILSVGLFANAVSDAADTVFQATEKMGYSLLLTVCSTLFYLVLGLLALWGGYGITGLAVANAAGFGLRLVLALLILRLKFFAPGLRIYWPAQATLLRSAVPFFLAGASAYLLSKSDVLILSRFVPLHTVGIYVAGYFFLDLALMLPNSFAQAIYPALARAAAGADGGLRLLTERFFKVVSAACLLVVLVTETLASVLIGLIYGEDYAAAVPVLQIVILSTVLVAYNNTVGRAIYAAGGQWNLLLVNVLGAATNIGLNLLLIPRLGLLGPSLVTVVSFMVTALAHGAIARRYGCAINVRQLTRLLPGFTLGLALASALLPVSWLLAAPAGVLVYLAGGLLFGFFSAAEILALARLIQPRSIMPGR